MEGRLNIDLLVWEILLCTSCVSTCCVGYVFYKIFYVFGEKEYNFTSHYKNTYNIHFVKYFISNKETYLQYRIIENYT